MMCFLAFVFLVSKYLELALVWAEVHFIDNLATKLLLLVHNLPIHEIYYHFLTKEGELIEDRTTNYPFLGSSYP